MTGITPAGLNASSQDEIEVFHDNTEANQEIYTPFVSKLLNLVQLSLFGEIDPEIGFQWEPLKVVTAEQKATIRKTNAETDATLIGAGIITAEESRRRIAGEEDSPYHGLDLTEELPDVPEPETGPLAHAEKLSGTQDDPDDDMSPDRAQDGNWNEDNHDRAQNGQFGAGGAASASPVQLKGDELGEWSSMSDLRQKAMQYAEQHFIGKKFANEATGNEIQVPKSGVKHTISGSGDELVRTIPAIPALIQKSTLAESVPESGGDPNIKAVETYEASVEIDGKQHRAIMTVKLYRDGRRYYDHGLVK